MWSRLVLLPAVFALGALAAPAAADSTSLDDFARCLSNKGAVLYGAWWCPKCRAQLKAFGDAADWLEYVDCYEPGTRNRNEGCEEDGVSSYPTWVFRDGSQLSGGVTFDRLAKKTGCTVPGGGETAARSARGR